MNDQIGVVSSLDMDRASVRRFSIDGVFMELETLCEGPVVLDNVLSVAEQGKAYRKPTKAKKKTKKTN